jgi:hypothetical protein
MEDITQIPRWVVEEDPLWEQDTNAGPNLMRWRKRGTNLFAICDISSMTCDLFDYSTNLPSFPNFLQAKSQSQGNLDTISRPDGPADIKRYLASRYLNPNYGTFKLLDSRSLKIRDRPDLKDIS